MSRRPDMRAYFGAQIDRHVRGGLSSSARLPGDVVRVSGTVRDSRIVVSMRDGSRWVWSGGRFAARKVDGCYAPLMPRPVAAEASA